MAVRAYLINKPAHLFSGAPPGPTSLPLTPNSTYTDGSGTFTDYDSTSNSIIHGGSTRWGVLADGLDSTYLTEGSGTSTYGPFTLLQWSGTFSPPSDVSLRVASFTAHARASDTTSNVVAVVPGVGWRFDVLTGSNASFVVPGTGVITAGTLGPFSRSDGSTMSVADVLSRFSLYTGDIFSVPSLFSMSPTTDAKLVDLYLTLQYAPSGPQTDKFYGGFTYTDFSTGPFTATWIAPAGVTSVTVEIFGAGGSGPSQNSPSNIGGGGGGGYERRTLAVTPGHSYTVTPDTAGDFLGSGTSSFVGDNGTCSATSGHVGISSGTAPGGTGTGSGGSGAVQHIGGTGASPIGPAGGGGCAGPTGNGGNASGATKGAGNSPGADGADGSNPTFENAQTPGGGGSTIRNNAFPGANPGGRSQINITYTLP